MLSYTQPVIVYIESSFKFKLVYANYYITLFSACQCLLFFSSRADCTFFYHIVIDTAFLHQFLDSEITVSGDFNYYKEGYSTYCQLLNAHMEEAV